MGEKKQNKTTKLLFPLWNMYIPANSPNKPREPMKFISQQRTSFAILVPPCCGSCKERLRRAVSHLLTCLCFNWSHSSLCRVNAERKATEQVLKVSVEHQYLTPLALHTGTIFQFALIRFKYFSCRRTTMVSAIKQCNAALICTSVVWEQKQWDFYTADSKHGVGTEKNQMQRYFVEKVNDLPVSS